MPTDSTPDPRDMERAPQVPEFPQPMPGLESDAPARAAVRAERAEFETAGRPALPEHPTMMAADVEDEDEDPVLDSGPGLVDATDVVQREPLLQRG